MKFWKVLERVVFGSSRLMLKSPQAKEGNELSSGFDQ